MIAPAVRRENVVDALAAIIMPRAMMSTYSAVSTMVPTRPNSSPNTARMKSVERSGTKSSCACVPLSQPLPRMPPEPIAIVDWMM